MPISLSKGGSVPLADKVGQASLDRILMGVGWDPDDGMVERVDIDASVVLLNARGHATSPDDFVFYGNLEHRSGAVTHRGDNRDGMGEGDDEVIEVQLRRLEATVDRVVVIVTIHDAAARRHHFGQVANAFVRVVNLDEGTELARFDLTRGADGEDCLAFAELFRDGADWSFAALGEYHDGGLAGALSTYHIDAS